MNEWFTNLLDTSWLSDVMLFGIIPGWLALVLGLVILVGLLAIPVIVLTVRARRFDRLAATGVPLAAEDAAAQRAHRSFWIAALILVPIVAFCFIAFWKYASWGWVVLAVFGIALAIVLFVKAIRWVVFLAILAAIGVLLTTIFGLWGLPPLFGGPNDVCKDPKPHAYTLDSGKETAYAFGPAVTQRDQADVIAETITRACNDRWLAASLNAAAGFSSLGDINHEAARFALSRTAWDNAVAELKEFMENAVYNRLEGDNAIPAGSPTLYMEPINGGKDIMVRHGSTIATGDGGEFVGKNGHVMKLRYGCGDQPIFEVPPSGLPECTKKNCPPPVCPWNPSLPWDSKDCLQPKSHKDDVESPQGWTNDLPLGPRTTGNESEQQQQSGDTTGNVVTDQVSGTTQTGDTTSDVGATGNGGTGTGGGGTTGSTGGGGATVDQTVTNLNPGGTTGDTEIGEPADG